MLLVVSYVQAQSPPKEIGRVEIVASGDTLLHYRVKKTARLQDKRDEKGNSLNNGGYDWVLEDVAPIFQQADIAFVNLESPTDPDYHRKIQGEIFNAPPVFLDSLAHAGIDIVSFANNHSFDQGPLGLLRTLDELKQRSISVVGAGGDCAAAREMKAIRVGQVTVGFLALSDLMNINDNQHPNEPCVYISGPRCEKDCLPDRDAIYYHIDEAALLRHVKESKRQVDLLVLSFHWGIEYNAKPLPLYTALAPKLMDAGVDLLLGHHSHTLQPVVRHTRPNGDEGIIAYSLGNLFSDMARRYRPNTNDKRGRTRDGVLLSASLQLLESEGKERHIRVADLSLIPLWTENNNNAEDPRIRVRTHTSILTEDPQKKDFLEHRRQIHSFLEFRP